MFERKRKKYRERLTKREKKRDREKNRKRERERKEEARERRGGALLLLASNDSAAFLASAGPGRPFRLIFTSVAVKNGCQLVSN